MTDHSHNVCWAAGLLEGEGHFGLRRSGTSLFVQLGMTDKDVVDRFQAIFSYWGSRKDRLLPSGKMFYILTISAQHEAREVMETVLPFMGERRSKQIEYCLREQSKKPLSNAEKSHCKHGHPLSGSNLRIAYEGKYVKRRCIICEGDRAAKYKAHITATAYLNP